MHTAQVQPFDSRVIIFESAKRIVCRRLEIISCDIQYWPCQEQMNTIMTVQGIANSSDTVIIDLNTSLQPTDYCYVINASRNGVTELFHGNFSELRISVHSCLIYYSTATHYCMAILQPYYNFQARNSAIVLSFKSNEVFLANGILSTCTHFGYYIIDNYYYMQVVLKLINPISTH